MKARVQAEESLAHIAQADAEALRELDAADARIGSFQRSAVDKLAANGTGPGPAKPALKRKRVVEPSKLVGAPYLETKDDVDSFLDTLRIELERAIANEERIEIR